MRKVVLALACVVVIVVAVFGGPIKSGALFLLLPNFASPVDHDLPASYVPLHKGGVDLATGLYVRDDEDLIVRGTPPLILRRTYLSNYRATKEFGIGTTHDGELYIIGDPERFQWTALILSSGTPVTFERISSGTSFINALYEHRATSSEWSGARLGWIGLGWALRRHDGALLLFRPCGPGDSRPCSILRKRDPDGHTIHYRRDRSGRLFRMEAATDRWIAFDYDGHDRIVRAYDTARHEVRYQYDERGRLSRVTGTDGQVHRYTYTDLDQMATIVENGTDIENVYNDDGRCIRQVNRYPDDEPYIFDFTYRTNAGNVVQTDTARSDGTWTRYTFDGSRHTTSETWGRTGFEPAIFTYERDPATNVVTALTLTCPDRTGRSLRHSSLVKPGYEEWIKQDLLQTHCSWSSWRGAGGTARPVLATPSINP